MAGEIVPPQNIPNQFLQQQNQQQAQQNPVSQVQEVQQIVSKLPAGAQLVAQITGADKQGNLTVRIAGSDLLLSSPIALAKGASLTLKVANTSDTVAFQLVSVDGKLPPTQAQQLSNFLQNPPSNALFRALGFDSVAQKNVQVPVPTNQATVASPQASGQSTAAVTTAASQAVIVGKATSAPVLQGIVLTPSPDAIRTITNSVQTLPADVAQQVATNIPKNLNTGAKVDFQISNVQTAQTQQPQSSAPANVPAQPNPQNPVDTSNTVLKGQDFQRTQNEQLMRDAGFVPRVNMAEDGVVKANAFVTAINGKQAVVETAIGRLVIPNRVEGGGLTVGSTLDLNITKFLPVDIDLEQTNLKDLFTQWPALKALQVSLPQNTATQVLNQLAGLDSLFASRIAGFLQSVKNNNLDNWLSADLLRDLSPELQDSLKAKLNGDFANFTRLYNDSQNSGWHTAFIPIFDGKELHQANFYVKDLVDEEEQEVGKRFVVELTTGAFGEVQMDGLVRKTAENNRFDLMVRTEKELPDYVRNGITEIFNNAMEVTGVKGGIDFAKLDSVALRPINAVMQNLMNHDGVQV